MDTNRSEEGSYSDDFEHDMESQDSPISEDKVEIKVYKSTVGALTIQPKKVSTSLAMVSDDNNDKSARTMSELSLMQIKSHTNNNNKPSTTGVGGRGVKRIGSKSNNTNNNGSIAGGKSLSLKVNAGSRTSLNTIGNLNRTINLGRPLAQEKLDPHDIPASVTASLSSVSLSRLSLRNRSATATGFNRGMPTNNIRRVVAHTSIKEKSYASAKYKTYHNPLLLRGVGVGNQPPLRVGLGKPNTNVSQRVASAKRMTIMDLKSKIKLLQDEIEKLKKENRFLNHLHHRQDNALRKWEGKDAELPRLLNQHKDEIRALQEHLRKAHQNARDHNEKLSVRDKKILRLEKELDKLKTLVHEEHLQDRHTLQQDLDITRMNLVGAEKRIREYMRHVEILEKNHRHQLAAQERKLIKVNTNTYELQQVVANLRLALRNKDRMLNYIQMRSTGRTLIRAFHAERVDRGDEMLYGTSIQTDLSRPYQPPTLGKSHSFEFGSSRCSSPLLLDEMKDSQFFSVEGSSKAKSVKLPSDAMSPSVESMVRAQQPSSSPRGKNKENSRSIPNCSIKAHGTKGSTFNSKSDSKRKGKKSMPSSKPLKNDIPTPTSKQFIVVDNFSNKWKQRAGGSGDASAGADKRANNIKNDNKNKNAMKSQSTKKSNSRSANERPVLGAAESKELVYGGNTHGFKYEGPFTHSNTSILDDRKDSTEVLYSPKSDKLSDRSLSSTYSSHTASSSRSEEIISNIDILSARIRESCVLVPPPEEAFKLSHTNQKKEAESKVQNNLQYSSKPAIGPAGDNMTLINQSSVLAAPAGESNQNQLSAFQNGILQPMQMVTTEQNMMNSPTSNQTLLSPRVQLLSLSGAPTTHSLPQGQFQLAQANYVAQEVVATNQSQQLVQSNSPVQYPASPRILQSFTPMQTVNVIPTEVSSHQGQQLTSPRLAQEYPYFSFANNSEIQEGLSPNNNNVAVFQASPQFTFQHAGFSSPQNSVNQANIHSPQQTMLVTPSAAGATTFPRMTFINSSQIGNNNNSNGGDQLPNVNNTASKNQSSYNPSYYVNLGNWK